MKLRTNVVLAKVFDTAYIQFVCTSQLSQFRAARDVAAVQPAIRNMPGIILGAMQPNGESLLAKLRQSGIEF